MNNALARLDPRLSLVAAIGWTLVVLSVGGAYLASVWVDALARHRLETQTGEVFKQYALQVSNELDLALYIRGQWIHAVGGLLATEIGGQSTEQQRQALQELQAALPELEWIGLTDTSGTVRVATGGRLERESVASESWFVEGAQRVWISDVHDAALRDRPLQAEPVRERHRIIDIAAPVVPAGQSRAIGVIGSHLSWSWAERLESLLIDALKPGRPVESLVVDRNNTVLLGPPKLVGTKVDFSSEGLTPNAGQRVLRWPDGGEYLSGYAVSDGVGFFPGLGWTVWVREPIRSAFADVRRLERKIFVALLALGLLGAAVSVLAMHRLTRKLAAIAQSADDIRLGKTTTVLVPNGANEAARIGQSLRMLVDGLHREKAALKALNTELDARVAARTREVERMSEENKHAAVVRERLRMARDLHDTLAHSLMALLTEIRLLRKLSDTDPGALKDELANAEEAALSGLREARAAIAQLRHDDVRDVGLGPLLAQLLKRFEEREGIAVAFDGDRRLDALADARAETLYRIAQESLHNVERHAQAARVNVSAHIQPVDHGASGDALILTIADDGVGFDATAPRPGHYGIRGMREQADLIGARFEVQSRPGHGTRVSVTMPL